MSMTIAESAAGMLVGAPMKLSWDSEDTVLYALAVGAGQTDPAEELQFTTDNTATHHRVLPTFAATLAGSAGVPALMKMLDGQFDPAGMLHGDQSHEQFAEFPPEGRATATTTIVGVWDKGSAAVVESATELVDDLSGSLLSRSRQAMFFRGAGGWGGDRGPSGSRSMAPESAPDRVLSAPTRRDQPLLYRLTGDTNPLHTDPEFAKRAGFAQPIMHGMCLYGIAGRVLLNELAGGDPARFVSMSVRFAGVVAPGDKLTVLVWNTGPGNVHFAVNDSAGQQVLSGGELSFLPARTIAPNKRSNK